MCVPIKKKEQFYMGLHCPSVYACSPDFFLCLPIFPPPDEDEDGDRITVCSDEELAAMLSYVSVCSVQR